MSTELIPFPVECPDRADDRLKVLIVDDEPVLVEVLCMRLEGQGFKTIGVYDGRSALSAAQEEKPDAVILDLHLPDTHGLDVCRTLAENPDTASIPVIILSGSDEPEVIRKIRAAGGCYFVAKPYDPNVLLLVLHQALESSWGW
ncbi:MAG: response regulator [Planctomycetota bacterium]|nr:MAG: response regulator [Planctomycetota bacterium]